MILFDEKGNKWTATKQKARPRMSEHFGRTWDKAYKTVNGAKTDFWRDYTWGNNWYFNFNGNWFALPCSTKDTFESDQGEEFFTKEAK